jgi:hypothetical protein
MLYLSWACSCMAICLYLKAWCVGDVDVGNGIACGLWQYTYGGALTMNKAMDEAMDMGNA